MTKDDTGEKGTVELGAVDFLVKHLNGMFADTKYPPEAVSRVMADISRRVVEECRAQRKTPLLHNETVCRIFPDRWCVPKRCSCAKECSEDAG